MANPLTEIILEKFENLPVPQLEKILKIAGGIEVYQIGAANLPAKSNPLSIFVGNSIPTSEVYQLIHDRYASHVLQFDRKDILFEMILSAVLCKQPDELIKPDSTFLLQKFTDKSSQTLKSLVLPFSSSREKSEIIDRIEAFLLGNPALQRLTPRIKQIADELIMNALFNAPVDKMGNRLFENTPRANPVEYPSQAKKARLKLHYDDSRILIGCEDPWGSMHEDDLRKHLARVTKESAQIATNRGLGSGLGLKMIIEGSTSFYIFVRKNFLTAVHCGFDLSVSYKKIEQTPKHAHIVFLG